MCSTQSNLDISLISWNLIIFSEISANSFENLMKKLKIETDPKQRSILSGSLTKTLLQPNGFIAYYEYLSSVSEDSHECIQLFCKVVLTRPSTFLNNAV